MNEKQAELIGMHVGDGTLYLSKKTLVWELRGSVHEKEFYSYVAKLISDLFRVEVKPKYRGLNSYGIQTTNKLITQFFVKNGFNPGKKVYSVRIPEYIKSAPRNIKLSFIRGLFDTDGCIRFDRNRTAFYYYPRIEFGFASEYLSIDLLNLLDDLGFRMYEWRTQREDEIAFRICLAGFKNLDKWIKEVKPANLKHINRIEDGLANKDKINLKSKSKNV